MSMGNSSLCGCRQAARFAFVLQSQGRSPSRVDVQAPASLALFRFARLVACVGLHLRDALFLDGGWTQLMLWQLLAPSVSQSGHRWTGEPQPSQVMAELKKGSKTPRASMPPKSDCCLHGAPKGEAVLLLPVARLDCCADALPHRALSAGPGWPPPPPWWSLSSSSLPGSTSRSGREDRSHTLQMQRRGVDVRPSQLLQHGRPQLVHGVAAARKFLQNMHSPLPCTSSGLLPKVRLQKVHLLPSVSKSVTRSLVTVQMVSQPRHGFCTCLNLVRAC